MGIPYSGRRRPASWGRRKDVGAATCGERKGGARCVAPAAWPQAFAVTTSQCIRIDPQKMHVLWPHQCGPSMRLGSAEENAHRVTGLQLRTDFALQTPAQLCTWHAALALRLWWHKSELEKSI